MAAPRRSWRARPARRDADRDQPERRSHCLRHPVGLRKEGTAETAETAKKRLQVRSSRTEKTAELAEIAEKRFAGQVRHVPKEPRRPRRRRQSHRNAEQVRFLTDGRNPDDNSTALY